MSNLQELVQSLTGVESVVSLVSQQHTRRAALDIKAPVLILMIMTLLGGGVAFAAPPDLEKQFGPRPIDGVYVEAIQTYSNPRTNHIGFDFGIWPVDPYWNGFSVSANYAYYFNKNHGWEVANVSYVYTVDSGLTTELADSYRVDPKREIERTNYVLSSNYLFTLAYGKFIFFGENIRYFRSTLILGPGLVTTNQKSYISACVGWGIETFVNDRISWKFSIRDNYAVSNSHPHNVAFSVGTSYGF